MDLSWTKEVPEQQDVQIHIFRAIQGSSKRKICMCGFLSHCIQSCEKIIAVVVSEL